MGARERVSSPQLSPHCMYCRLSCCLFNVFKPEVVSFRVKGDSCWCALSVETANKRTQKEKGRDRDKETDGDMRRH